MPCDTKLKKNQTIQQRAAEIRTVVERLSRKLATGQAKVVIGPQGAVAFSGLTDSERDGVTDACVYRRIMATGSSLAKQAIARAEAMSGRAVDRKALAAGIHSHDGGRTFHNGH
jgi:hypothetical protein